MIGIVLITHGEFAMGLKDAVELIMGPQDAFKVISIYEGMDLNKFSNSVLNTIKELNNEEVIVFVDMFGATPFNTVIQQKRKIESLGKKINIITGVNLPMLLETFGTRGNKDFEQLSDDIIQSGKDGIELLSVIKNGT